MSEKYRNDLEGYLHKIFPPYSDDYVKYEVEESIGGHEKLSQSLIVVDENNQIVGCHIGLKTKAYIHGYIKDVIWGHNTFLDEKYRRDAGLDFILQIANLPNGFGYGLTDTNIKIQKKLKGAIFLRGLRSYRLVNMWTFWAEIKKLFAISPKLPNNMPKSITIDNNEFVLCTNVNELTVPNDGFWYKDISDVDFVRDCTFLDKRFFKSKVHKYYVYTIVGTNCYFVIRPTIYHGFLSLIVADFRYLPYKYEFADLIFRAIEKICHHMRIGVMFFITSDKYLNQIYQNRKLCNSFPITFVAGRDNVDSEDSYVIVNGADSDGEIYK